MTLFETISASVREIETEARDSADATFRQGARFALFSLVGDLRTQNLLSSEEYQELHAVLNPEIGSWARFASEPEPILTVNGIRFTLQDSGRYYSPSYPEFTFANEAEITAFITPPHVWPKNGVNLGDLIE